MNCEPPGGNIFQQTGNIFIEQKMKNNPFLGGHVFQPTGTIFQLVQDITGSFLKKCPVPNGHVFLATGTIFELFHEDRTINVASREKCPASGSHVLQANIINVQLVQDISGSILVTKFHVAPREKCPAPDGHVFLATGTIFALVQGIIETNHLTKFHEVVIINVASRVLTSHVFQPIGSIVAQIQDIIWTNLLTKFHEDWTINVAAGDKGTAPGGHVFKATGTIFKYVLDIIGTNLLTKVLTMKNASPSGGYGFQPTDIIFEFVQDIIGMIHLTKFHEDRTINVASIMLTMFLLPYSHIGKNDPPLGSHVYQANVTIFELIQEFIETNLLTKFHEDWTINANVDAARTTDDR
ncbi:hypothetical protein DPMN_132882 [Dreissena polymorpha]|uniref:Uncharacterized protein n=1 Tax=Dreissena polymorpha TaxID=45954 RepID=A0A9D4FSG8_DREPO|nr:hypothetical protein DPMN_132882 [Dreissena polymorpha]